MSAPQYMRCCAFYATGTACRDSPERVAGRGSPEEVADRGVCDIASHDVPVTSLANLRWTIERAPDRDSVSCRVHLYGCDEPGEIEECSGPGSGCVPSLRGPPESAMAPGTAAVVAPAPAAGHSRRRRVAREREAPCRCRSDSAEGRASRPEKTVQPFAVRRKCCIMKHLCRKSTH